MIKKIAIIVVASILLFTSCGKKEDIYKKPKVEVTDVTQNKTTTTTKKSDNPKSGGSQNNSSDNKNDESETRNIIDYAEYSSFKIYSTFTNGYAWIEYEDNEGVMHYGAIDSDGNIIYSIEHYKWFMPSEFDSRGYSCYGYGTQERGGFATYVIIDSDGNNCYICPNTDNERIGIYGHGDGLFLAHQHVSSFDESANYIITMDAYGNILSSEKAELFSVSGLFDYFENGVLIFDQLMTGNDRVLFNFNTSNWYILRSGKIIQPFINGESLYEIDGKYYPITINDLDTEETYIEWKKALSDDKAIQEPTLPYPETVKVIEWGKLYNGLFPVFLKGADGYIYYTLVNTEGEQRFDPIKISSTEKRKDNCKKGLYIYKTETGTHIIDSEGNDTVYSKDGYKDFDGDYIYMDGKIISINDGTTIENVKKALN